MFGWDSSDVLYDNAQFTGWHTGYPDMLARLDPTTLRVVPWEPNTAFMLGDFYNAAGLPLEICPRQTLKRIVEKTKKLGFEPIGALEFEFFFFKETPQSVREKNYRNLTPLTPGMFGYSILRASSQQELVHALLKNLKEYDIELEGFHTETGPGVYEAAIRYDEFLKIADKAALFKTAVKEIAARNGVMVSFMAKTSPNLPGCSGHMHQSLWDKEKKQNLFADPKDENGMSTLFKNYVAGQLKYMPETTVFVAPTINSYKRTGKHTLAWAPCNVTWGMDNRTTALRVILGPAGLSSVGKSTRVEYRLAGADINPYIAMAASLASGLAGIEQKLSLGKPLKGSAYTLSVKEATPLPRSLEESTALLKESKFARDHLGSSFVDHFVSTREWEVEQFKRAVTNWELERYFEII